MTEDPRRTIDPSFTLEDIRSGRLRRSPVMGVSRAADNEQAILIHFRERPSDDDLRPLHAFLRGWRHSL